MTIMHAYIFPGQGAQYPGMEETYETSSEAKSLFEEPMIF